MLETFTEKHVCAEVPDTIGELVHLVITNLFGLCGWNTLKVEVP